MKRIMHVVGARPNFMKIAPIMREMNNHPDEFEQVLVHTGQHYDANMSQIFFEELGLPKPDMNLEVGSGSHSWQTAEVMVRFEPVVLDYGPDWVIVPGDVNSTLACAIVASKLNMRLAHVEAGLRSFDRRMPEEINRVLTDQIADLLFTPSQDGDENLIREGVSIDKIHFVGNVMIDTLVRLLPLARTRWPMLKQKHGLSNYILVTLHRPSNVDEQARLGKIVQSLAELATEIPILFPAHPRTVARLEKWDMLPDHPNLMLVEPLGYLDFLAAQDQAEMVITDSGGIQEETTFLNVPCLTVRPSTERPITLTQGTNHLIGYDELLDSARSLLLDNGSDKLKEDAIPEYWDGRAASRIVEVFRQEK
jgi:UDP-N-acetylglucosamine 2-epimerase (non-hydrolysing)